MDYQKMVYTYCVPPMLIICLISLVINLKVLLCVHWIRRPLSPILMISLSLAAADACTSAFIGIGLFLHSYLATVFNISVPQMISGIIEICRLSGCIVTVAHLFALSVNHYLGIIKPLHYHSIVTPKKVTVIIIILWVCPTTFIASYFIVASEEEFWQDGSTALTFLDRFKFRIIFSSLFFVPLILMSFFYIHIVFIVRKQQKKWSQMQRCGSTRWKAVRTSSKQTSNNRNEQRQMEGNVRAIKTTLLILGSCVMGWIPAILAFTLMCRVDCPVNGTQLVHIANKYNLEMFGLMWLKTSFLILKTLLNPIIYTTRMKEIQDGTQRMHSAIGQLCCPSRRQRNINCYAVDSETTSNVKRTALRQFRNNGSVKHRSVSPCELLNTLL